MELQEYGVGAMVLAIKLDGAKASSASKGLQQHPLDTKHQFSG